MTSENPKKGIQFKKLGYLETLLTVVILGGITTFLYLYTSGYRLDKNGSGEIDIEKPE